ncbi:hypothetical protein OG455_41200 [Kitasatospora sp. NBC_01287]|uniref:hypothetical protein n=1 Tax=Kitasatospora sp. NBC_01287 TaxID=2903573 RepID=UPI00225544B7|nr:hypothetical protein [Kitasatospora sp. NBC_01287]MCX4750900.1 hypothetical protein [Kitasatospora sp. NBC_01287]MCX4751859.1 hypothetical protein [Kitasatospora sp. NBC_01287]
MAEYATVQTTIFPGPIEVPLDEVQVLRSQGLLVEPAAAPTDPDLAPAPRGSAQKDMTP